MSNTKWLALGGIPVLLALGGCAMNQQVRYSLDEIAPSNPSHLQSLTFNIDDFEDARGRDKKSAVLFNQARESNVNGQHSCINAEEHYQHTPMSKQFSTLLAKHFEKRGTFKTVLVNSRSQADYTLTGRIDRLYGAQDYSTNAMIGSQFGLIGALMTMGTTTDGEVDIGLSDLKIVDKNGTVVANLPMYDDHFMGALSADGYCWKIFENVNARLKMINTKIVESSEKAMARYVGERK